MLTITPETPIAALTVQQFKELFFSSTQVKRPQTEKFHQESQIFGLKECSKITGYSESAIYQRTSKGLIPCFRRDGKLLFDRDEIYAWMTENRIKTQNEHIEELDNKLIKGRRRK